MINLTNLNEHEIRTEIKKIIDDTINRIKYEDSDLYFINKEQMEILKLLKISASKIQLKSGKRKTKVEFFSFAKILNLDYPVIQYELFLKHKYKNIKDLNNTIDPTKKINTEYHICIAETEEYYKKLIEDYGHEFSTEKLELIAKEKEEKLKKAREILAELTNNFSGNIIKISTFSENVLRPHIKFIDSNGTEKVDYLRKEVPNFLYAHMNISKIIPGYRKNATHIEFILSSIHAFGDIYYKPKEDEKIEDN